MTDLTARGDLVYLWAASAGGILNDSQSSILSKLLGHIVPHLLEFKEALAIGTNENHGDFLIR
jgi:hypothetical protein